MRKTLQYTIKISMAAGVFIFNSCSSDITGTTDLSNLNAAAKDVSLLKSTLKTPSYLVLFNDEGAIPKDFANKLKKGESLDFDLAMVGMASVSSDDPNFEKRFSNDSSVQSVIPDLELQWIADPKDAVLVNDEHIGSDEAYYKGGFLWGLDAIKAPQAWDKGYTGKGVKIAVLDSGINHTHVDLDGNINFALSKSFISGEDWRVRPGSYFNHGSHVAGTIAAEDNGRGVIGVAPYAQIIAIKVLSEYSGTGPFSSINKGIVYAADAGAQIINMSLGTNLFKNGTIVLKDGSTVKVPAVQIQNIIKAQQRAIDYAYKKGVTIIASAGNEGINVDGDGSQIKLPGGLNNVITVSATAPEGYVGLPTNFDIPASYTNYGKSLVDIAAPGGDFDTGNIYDYILSTSPGGYYFSAGTSMAAPHVSGVAALIIQKNGGKMSPQEVAKQLYKTADSFGAQNVYFNKGRVNAYRAVTE